MITWKHFKTALIGLSVSVVMLMSSCSKDEDPPQPDTRSYKAILAFNYQQKQIAKESTLIMYLNSDSIAKKTLPSTGSGTTSFGFMQVKIGDNITVKCTDLGKPKTCRFFLRIYTNDSTYRDIDSEVMKDVDEWYFTMDVK